MWALLPLKDFVQAKQRLSGVLSATERRSLFHAMVQDVLEVLSREPALQRLVLVSDDPTASLLAEHYRADCWREAEVGGRGLNGVVRAAVQRMAGDTDTVMIVHGDLPLLNAAELRELIAQHRCEPAPRKVTLATDRRGEGSNVLLCSPPAVIDFAYGPDSNRRHRELAAAAGAQFNECRLPGIGRDIDVSDDLQDLLDPRWQGRAVYTLRYLRDSGLDARLRAMAAGTANTDYHKRDLS